LLPSVKKKKKKLTQSNLVKPCKLVALVDVLGGHRHCAKIDETEDENDAWPKVTENQTNHVVVTLSQQGSTGHGHASYNGCRK